MRDQILNVSHELVNALKYKPTVVAKVIVNTPFHSISNIMIQSEKSTFIAIKLPIEPSFP